MIYEKYCTAWDGVFENVSYRSLKSGVFNTNIYGIQKQETRRVSVQQSLSSLAHIVDLTLRNHSELGAVHIQNKVDVARFNLSRGGCLLFSGT